MNKIWQMQEAQARFRELLETCRVHGPQIVTQQGVPAAVLVSIEQWRRMESGGQPTLKELLLAPEPRTESLVPPRARLVRRDPGPLP